jgi:hypothetical protein
VEGAFEFFNKIPSDFCERLIINIVYYKIDEEVGEFLTILTKFNKLKSLKLGIYPRINYFRVPGILDFNLTEINIEMFSPLVEIILRNNYNLLNTVQYKTNINDLEDAFINVCKNFKNSLIIESMNDKK